MAEIVMGNLIANTSVFYQKSNILQNIQHRLNFQYVHVLFFVSVRFCDLKDNFGGLKSFALQVVKKNIRILQSKRNVVL